jgi:uncharacterized protein YjbI with pentapeptide repeats
LPGSTPPDVRKRRHPQPAPARKPRWPRQREPVPIHPARDPAPTRPPRDWIAITATALPGIAALVALIFASLSVRATNDQLQIAQQGQITDRYNAAITNLGSSSIDIRLGGIYALQRLMQDSPRDRNTVIAVLCAFVRDEAPAPAKPLRLHAELNYRQPTDVQAALTIVGTRGPKHDTRTTVVDFNHGQLAHAFLARMHLSRANLSFTNLTGAALDEADLDSADLTNADLTDAHLLGADLGGAGLGGADLHGATLGLADLTNTGLNSVDFHGADLRYADFTGAISTGANLHGAQLKDAKFARSLFNNADFTGANLTGASFTSAVLIGADFTGAKLTGADFTGAVLRGARWPADVAAPKGWLRDTASGRLEEQPG